MVRFGANVQRVRLASGLSIRGLARAARLSRNYVAQVERGERNVSLTTLLRLAAALTVDPSELLPLNVNDATSWEASHGD